MADIKVSEMLQETTPEATDLLPLVRTSATSNKNRKIPLSTLFGNVPTQIGTVNGIASGGWQTVAITGAMVISKENVHLDIGASPINVVVPNGTVDGQVLLFLVRSASSNCNITPLNAMGFTTVLLTAVGKSLTLKWDGVQSKWFVQATHGGTVS